MGKSGVQRMYGDEVPPDVRRHIEQVFADSGQSFEIPPPVFLAMQGRLVGYDSEEKVLKAAFPVLPDQLNPYGTMQGGMIAAAIDNTLGPLSMLVAPANFTRHLEVKYRKSIMPETGSITVEGRFVGRRKRRLSFEAFVLDGEGEQMASAKAIHWIVDKGG